MSKIFFKLVNINWKSYKTWAAKSYLSALIDMASHFYINQLLSVLIGTLF